MGAGAALTIPASLSIINDVFRDPARRARAIGAWGGTIGLGIAVGPIAGGLLLAAVLVGLDLHGQRPDRRRRLRRCAGARARLEEPRPGETPDPGGALWSIAGLGLLLWAIIEAPLQGLDRRRGDRRPVSPALVVLAVFVALGSPQRPPDVEARAVLATAVSRSPPPARASAPSVCLGALFLQTQVLQFDLGYSPLAGRGEDPARGRACSS